MTAQQEGGSTPAGPFVDGHLSTCMLAASDWDKACFTASELECTCDLEGRASAYIADLREKLADALKLASGMSVHASDCTTSCAPAEEPAACDCTRYEPAPLLVRSAPAGMVALNIAQQALWQYESDLRYPPTGDNVERRLSAAQTASKAVADAIAQVQPLSTPAGMVAWAGGDAALEDWDGGPILQRDGKLYRPLLPTDAVWQRGMYGNPAVCAECDAVAYTPRTPAGEGSGVGGHTPTPWEWDAGVIPPDGPERYADIYVIDEDREPITIAEFNDSIPEGRANAAFIVRAVNSHAGLVDALKEALQALDASRGTGAYPDFEAWEAKAREALARSDASEGGGK